MYLKSISHKRKHFLMETEESKICVKKEFVVEFLETIFKCIKYYTLKIFHVLVIVKFALLQGAFKKIFSHFLMDIVFSLWKHIVKFDVIGYKLIYFS